MGKIVGKSRSGKARILWEKHLELDGAMTFSTAGVLGREARFRNAHTIRDGWNYTGSPPPAFGGAKKWPCVTAQISFVSGQERQARQVAERLKKFIEDVFRKEVKSCAGKGAKSKTRRPRRISR